MFAATLLAPFWEKLVSSPPTVIEAGVVDPGWQGEVSGRYRELY